MHTDPSTIAELIDCAHALADAARAPTLQHFRALSLVTDNKLAEGFDPVTEGDRQAEQAMRDVLAKRRPNDSILGEEFGFTQGNSGLTWVLDPIDGTRGFICGTPTWGVLIAVHNGGTPLFGVIDQPYIGERFAGGFGVASMTGPLGKRDLVVRQVSDVSDAIIFTTFPEVGSKVEAAGFHDLASRCKLTRYGMDCYAYALLAAGQVDLVVEAGLSTYDIQAPIAVIEAAGGIVTDWQGGPAYEGGRVLAAGCAELHARALEVLRKVPD